MCKMITKDFNISGRESNAFGINSSMYTIEHYGYVIFPMHLVQKENVMASWFIMVSMTWWYRNIACGKNSWEIWKQTTPELSAYRAGFKPTNFVWWQNPPKSTFSADQVQLAAPFGLPTFRQEKEPTFRPSISCKGNPVQRDAVQLKNKTNHLNTLAYPSWKWVWTKIHQNVFPFVVPSKNHWKVHVIFSLSRVFISKFLFFWSGLFENEQTHKDWSKTFTSTCFVAQKNLNLGPQ